MDKNIDKPFDLGSELPHCLTQYRTFKTSFADGKFGLLPLRLIITHQTDKNLYLSNEAKCGKHKDHLKCVRQEMLPSY